MNIGDFNIDPDVKLTLDKVMKLLTENLGNLFSAVPETITAKSEDTFEIIMKKRTSMEYLIPVLIHVLKTRVLYGIGDSTNRRQSSVLYSIPYFNNMYTIYMYSDSFGIISTMTITVYDSMEKEYYKLNSELRKLRSHRGIIYEEEKPIDLAAIFI